MVDWDKTINLVEKTWVKSYSLEPIQRSIIHGHDHKTESQKVLVDGTTRRTVAVVRGDLGF